MSKLIFAAVAISVAQAASAAPCMTNDRWTGPDKTMHFAAGAAVGSAGTLVFKSPHAGFALGVGVAAVKELIDIKRHGHTCSLQDFGVTVLGAAGGAYGTAFIVGPRFIGFTTKF